MQEVSVGPYEISRKPKEADMLFAPIVPIPMLPQIKNSNYHMVLAPQCCMEEYELFYKNVSGFKILDNGAAEGVTTDPDELLGWYHTLLCDEIIVPDAMHDAQKTIDMLVPFCRAVIPQGVKVMAVLQAKTWYEFDYI